MRNADQNKTISAFLILAGLWFVNILIVVFSLPFLLYRKIREAVRPQPALGDRKDREPTRFFPCGMNSK